MTIGRDAAIGNSKRLGLGGGRNSAVVGGRWWQREICESGSEREKEILERERERLGFDYRAFLIYRALITLGDERLQQKLKVNKLKIKHLQEETIETRIS